MEKSAVQNNMKDSNLQKYIHEVDTSKLRNEDQSRWEKILIPNKINFDLNNPLFELCLKRKDSEVDPHLETSRKSEKLYKRNSSSCEGEEKNQALSLSMIKNLSDFSAANLPNVIENCTNFCEEKAKINEKNYQKAIQLMKPAVKNKASKKRRHEEGVFNSSMLEECDAAKKKFMFKTEEESYAGNPYLEFILESEDSNAHLNFKGNSEGHDENNLALGREEKMVKKDKRLVENGGDIFGNNFTSKDRNKFKVNCPHCTKKVPAPGFVRHLTYCMKVGIRKRTRRS